MHVPLTNQPRDYAWGSTTLLADLEGRQPTGLPEAEIWFGDHPANPSLTPDGTPLDAGRLPYLLKLLAASSALSIQAHPSKSQAEAGFAREEAAGIPRDAGERTYRDDNHKPELIVSVSPTFRALAGLRDLAATRRLIALLGPGARPLADRLAAADGSLSEAIGWLLSEDGRDDAARVIAAAVTAQSDEFASELSLARELNAQYPGDPGVVVALLMNLVTLRRGEGLFVPAGVLHAYLEGLGVELMAASDNVLRGGLTPKHIDVAELLTVLDATPGPPAILTAEPIAEGVEQFPVPVDDFALLRITVTAEAPVNTAVPGPAIALCVAGAITADSVPLVPGGAVYIDPADDTVTLSGEGQAYIALSRSTPRLAGTALR